MNRRRFRSLFPYLLIAVLLIALAAGFLLSRRSADSADVSDPAGRVYVSEAGERSAAEAQSQIRAARKSASAASTAAEPSGTAGPAPTETAPAETLPTAPPETVPPVTEPPVTEPAGSDSDPRTDAPTEAPAETTAETPVETSAGPEPTTEPEPVTTEPEPATTEPGPSPEALLASLQEQIRTLNIDLFTPDELASIRRRFDNAVFTGDSMAQGLVSFELFDENHVKFLRGASVGEFDPQIQAAIDTLPDYFIFFTGCNNVSTYINDPTEYYRQFVSRIEWVKSALPDTEIYVICMLPASDHFIQYENYHVARQPEYDAQLKLVCQDTGVHYVDCHWMVRQELYLEDGLHFNLAFYTVLIKFLAMEMGL